MSDNLLMKGFSLVSEDGAFVRIEETPERERVILSIFRDGKTETASLNKEMFDALLVINYKIDVSYPKKSKTTVEASNGNTESE